MEFPPFLGDVSAILSIGQTMFIFIGNNFVCEIARFWLLLNLTNQ